MLIAVSGALPSSGMVASAWRTSPCSGRLAQWESASFTPKRSGVRNPDRPPRYRRSKALSMILDRAFPVQHPQKSHTLFPDCLVKSRGDGVEVVREEVAVGVQGQDRRGVTEHRLYGLDVRPAAHRERCRRMS